MGANLLDSAKKVFREGSSSSKVVSDHPLRNDESCSALEGRYHGFSKKEGTTTVRKEIPSRGGGAVSRTPNPQPTREPMQVFPLKETIPPKSIQRPSYRGRQNSMHEPRALPKEKKDLQDQLLATQDTLDTVLNISETRMKEIRRLQEEIKRLDSVVISMVSAEKEAGNKICDLERRIQVQNQDIRNLQQRLRISEEQCSQKTKLLNERTAELKGAQVFLTTADRYSGADIIKMVETLNAEIFQASAMMAELLVDAPSAGDAVQFQGYKKYLDEGRRITGSRLFDHLVTKSNEIRVDPLPLQLAFQALFAWWCWYEMDSFCDGPAGESLKQIYGRIYESEIQAVAGRWRVITSVQTMNSGAPSHADLVFRIILGLMCICGWFKSDTSSKRATLSIEQAVLRVERMWKTLKAATMQEITAAEITIIHFGAGCDYNVAKMDDMYMDTRGDATTNRDDCGQRILCTIGVGLQRGVSKRSENGTMQIHQEVILKPKVALASVLLNGESLDTREDIVLSATNGNS